MTQTITLDCDPNHNPIPLPHLTTAHDQWVSPSGSVQQSTEDSCTPAIKIFERKHVFAYFILHVCFWIQSIFWQHYPKIKLQFDVLKLRKRKHIATHINNGDNVIAEGGCVRKCTLIRNLSTYAFLHTEIYHVAFPLEKKVRTFTPMFTAFVY